jgi:hypothetical protein
MNRPAKAALFGAALAVAAACTSPTLICGCVLPPPLVTLFGTVRAAGGAPVAGARVSAQIMPVGCSRASARQTSEGNFRPQTDAAGAYAFTFAAAEERACIRVVAERAPGDTTFVQADSVALGASGIHEPRLQFDLAFP